MIQALKEMKQDSQTETANLRCAIRIAGLENFCLQTNFHFLKNPEWAILVGNILFSLRIIFHSHPWDRNLDPDRNLDHPQKYI